MSYRKSEVEGFGLDSQLFGFLDAHKSPFLALQRMTQTTLNSDHVCFACLCSFIPKTKKMLHRLPESEGGSAVKGGGRGGRGGGGGGRLVGSSCG